MGFTLPKQNDEELPVGEDGHTRAPDHTRDRMGEFLSVAFWNWSQPSTDWFNLATGEALAEYTPSPAMRELVAGVESQARRPSFEGVGGEIGHITLANASLVARRRTSTFPPPVRHAISRTSSHVNASATGPPRN